MLKHAFLLGLTLILIGGCNVLAEEDPEIRIGLIAPLSGNLPEIGQSTVEAAQLRAQEINETGGLEVEGRYYLVRLVVEDSGDNAQAAVQATLKLINQAEIVALVGPQSSRNAIPVAQVAEESHIPMISPGSTHPQTTLDKPYVFRVAFTDDFQGRVLARFAYEELGFRQAAVLYDIANPYSRGLAEVFEESFTALGGETIASERYTTGEQDFALHFQRIEQSGAEFVFLPNFTHEIPIQIRQAREIGLTVPFIGSDTWQALQEAENLSLLEGSYFSSNWSDDLATEQAKTFIRAYHQAYQSEATDVAALTYDAVGLLGQAIEKENSFEPEAIRMGLAHTENYPGVTGRISFQETGDPIRNVIIIKIEEGQHVVYKTVDP